MTMGLVELWLLSLLLSGSSLLIMSGLVVARVVREVWANRVQVRRAQLIREIMQSLEQDQTYAPGLNIRSGELPLVSDISLELLTLISGEYHKRLVRLLTRLGLASFLRHRLARRSARSASKAAEFLRYFPGHETEAALYRGLTHRSTEVRIASAISLCELDQNFPVDVLVRDLRIGTHEQSRLVVDLFKRVAPKQKDRLLQIAQDEDAPLSVRTMALEALPSSGDYALVEPLSRMALASCGELKAKTLECLGNFGHPAALPAVTAALNDTDWLIRQKGAVAAGLIGFDSLADQLRLLLRDEVWSVQFQAGEALLRLGETGIAKLVQVSQSRDEVERRCAALALAERGL